jgi:hypothetical protein
MMTLPFVIVPWWTNYKCLIEFSVLLLVCCYSFITFLICFIFVEFLFWNEYVTLLYSVLFCFDNVSNIYDIIRFETLFNLHSTLKMRDQNSRPPLDPTRDWIGPADPVSRIRPIHLQRSRFETEAERSYRTQREALQHWNDVFWRAHNQIYDKVWLSVNEIIASLCLQERQEYLQRALSANQQLQTPLDKDTVSTNALNEFYKDFLNKRRSALLQYNWHVAVFTLIKMCI